MSARRHGGGARRAVGHVFSPNVAVRGDRRVCVRDTCIACCRFSHHRVPLLRRFTSLDRHARLYDSNTRRLQYSIYLKQHLTKSLLSGAVEQPRGGGRGRTAAIDMPITDAMAAKAEEAVRRARARTEIGDTDWDEADDNQLWATLPTAVEPEHDDDDNDDDDDDAGGESSTEHGTLPSDLPDESDSDTSSSSSSDNEPTPPPRRNAKRKAAAAPKNTRATRRK